MTNLRTKLRLTSIGVLAIVFLSIAMVALVEVPHQKPRHLILDALDCEGVRRLGLSPSPIDRGICELEAKAAFGSDWMKIGNFLAAWLLGDGWDVLIPAIDHGEKTALVVDDDSRYYRIQVKGLQSDSEDAVVENKWRSAKIDYVAYFQLPASGGTSLLHFPKNAGR